MRCPVLCDPDQAVGSLYVTNIVCGVWRVCVMYCVCVERVLCVSDCLCVCVTVFARSCACIVRGSITNGEVSN